MRIDDENKVVWCSEELINIHGKEVVRSTRYDTVFVAIKLYKRGTIDDLFETQIEFEEYLKVILDGYTFKLEQPKKYYWRKKKEHLAWFEDTEAIYLNVYFSEVYLGVLGDSDNYEFTEQEARDLLIDDFDKFERVEVD